MYIEDVAKIICVKETKSEDKLVTIKEYYTNEIIWRGRAKDLINQKNLYKFIVVEYLIDWSSAELYGPSTPLYNYDKVIMVI